MYRSNTAAGKKKLFWKFPALNNSSRSRLNWKQMELQEGWNVVKGTTHRVIVVKSPDERYFEEAIFIVRDDILQERGADSAAVLKEARKAANAYLGIKQIPGAMQNGQKAKKPGKKSDKRYKLYVKFPAPVFAAAGAAATGVVWITSRLCGL